MSRKLGTYHCFLRQPGRFCNHLQNKPRPGAKNARFYLWFQQKNCIIKLINALCRTFYAVILADKQEFINAELTGAGHCTVHTVCIDALPARLAESRERTLQEATVPSLRADAVLAAMLHTSRTRAAEYIAAGRVEINHLPLKAAHETAYAADIFTVRGVGRFKLAAIGGKSRKDRLFISFYQY